MDSASYLAAAARTAASQAHWQQLPPATLAATLAETQHALAHLDAAKKTLFYGKPLAQDLPETTTALPPLSDPVFLDYLHGALGIATEAAEILSLIMIMWQNQGEITAEQRLALAEECGDVEWYLAMLYRRLGVLPEQIRAANIAKLAARFPERFDSAAAQVRDVAEERSALLATLQAAAALNKAPSGV
jgi:hypothetical protein